MTKSKVSWKSIKTGLVKVLGDAVQGLASWFGLDKTIQSWVNDSSGKSQKYLDAIADIAKSASNRNDALDRISSVLNQAQNAGMLIGGNTALSIGERIDKIKEAYKDAKAANDVASVVENQISSLASDEQSLGSYMAGDSSNDSEINKLKETRDQYGKTVQQIENSL